MSQPLVLDHTHQPVYRVVGRACENPLDPSHTQRRSHPGAWNTPEFAALYCCCSEWVARAVARDVFRRAGVDLTDLQPAFRPQLVEISWAGEVIDLVSEGGIDAAGFPEGYPAGLTPDQMRRAAARWRAAGALGLVCRSPALHRFGFQEWTGAHHRWSELVIFPANSATAPALLRRRDDLDWL